VKKVRLCVAAFAALMLAVVPAHAQEEAQEEDPGGFKIFWRDGTRLETNDGNVQIRFGGRIQYDWVFWSDDSDIAGATAVPVADGTEFRRARVFFSGYVYEKFEFKIQYDFAGGKTAIKDLYFGIRHPKYGFRMGHMKEPFSLEELTSSKYVTFAERALPSVFDSERNSGFMLHGNIIGGNYNYGVGLFRETGSDGIGIEKDRYNIVGRFAGALVNRDGGRKVVHLGGSALHATDSGADRVYTQRPEVHLSPRFVSSGAIPTDGLSLLAVEGAVVQGPFSVQAEWKYAIIDSDEVGDPRLWGWYAYGSYFLTGESRNYQNSVFGRITPKRNFLEEGGLGALEIAVRYSALDVDGAEKASDALIKGSRLDNITIGANWHWNPLTTMKFNVVHADIRDVGSIWAFIWRGQIEF